MYPEGSDALDERWTRSPVSVSKFISPPDPPPLEAHLRVQPRGRTTDLQTRGHCNILAEWLDWLPHWWVTSEFGEMLWTFEPGQHHPCHLHFSRVRSLEAFLVFVLLEVSTWLFPAPRVPGAEIRRQNALPALHTPRMKVILQTGGLCLRKVRGHLDSLPEKALICLCHVPGSHCPAPWVPGVLGQ